jgi:hypothetical protein
MSVGLAPIQPGGLETPEQRLARQQAELAEYTRSMASAQAGQQDAADIAGAQYAQAAAAPMPDVNPIGAMITSLGANLAASLGERPQYREDAKAELAARRNTLIAQRMQTLAAMKDNYERQAIAAKESGDFLTEQKLLEKKNNIAKTEMDMHEASVREQTVADADKKNQWDIDADLRAHNYRMEELAAHPTATSGGVGSEPLTEESIHNKALMVESGQIAITSLPNRKGNNERSRVIDYMQKNGMVILIPKARDTMQVLSAAEGILDELSTLSANINIGDKGTRFIEGSKAAMGGALQSRPDVAVYNSARQGFLATIARSTGERGVLTDRDILRAQQLIPGVYDSNEVATGKILMLREFIAGMKQRTIKNYTQPMAGVLSGPAPDISKGVAKKDTTPITMRGPKNELRTIEAWEIPDAVKHGWKRAK